MTVVPGKDCVYYDTDRRLFVPEVCETGFHMLVCRIPGRIRP